MADTPEIHDEGYWVVLGQNPPEVAYWERGERRLCGNENPWQPARCVTQPGTAMTVKEMGLPWRRVGPVLRLANQPLSHASVVIRYRYRVGSQDFNNIQTGQSGEGVRDKPVKC